jgi:hypothetical protein
MRLAAMKRVLIPTGLVIASIVVVVLLFELALRVIGFSDPLLYAPDPHLGWTLRPGAEGWYMGEGHAYVRINSAGLRDREHSIKKPDGVYRVAVLGDSYAEALQVDVKDTFWSLLERHVEQCAFRPGKRIEVINFGVSGYGTAQEYLQLESTAIHYRPDLVLLMFTHGNDVRDNSILLTDEKGRPFFRLSPQGGLTLDESFAETPAFRRRSSAFYEIVRALSDYFRVLQFFQSARHVLASRLNGEGPRGTEVGGDVLAPPRDPSWDNAWVVTERILAAANEFASRNGIQFLVAIVTSQAQVYPDRRVREDLQKKLGVPDLFYPERRMAKFAKKQGIHMVPLAYEMQRLADADRIYFHGFKKVGMGIGHWNENGHRVVAQIIARALCSPPS